MENKIRDRLRLFFAGDGKKVKIICAVGLIGMILILASELIPSGSGDTQQSSEVQTDYAEYTAELEDKLTSVISSIDGVGECKVMITLENSTESVYATDSEISADDSSTDKKDEYVFYESSDGDEPVLIKEYMPKVMGVTVVCSGGDDVVTEEKIIESVSALFNISANRISVSKIKD